MQIFCKKTFHILVVFFICLHSAIFTDIASTRQELSKYSNENSRILALYDQMTSTWLAYEKEYENTYNTQWDFDPLLQAISYAAEKHAVQYRKDREKTPYIIHPLGVAKLLWDIGKVRNVHTLVSALLHDTLEDTFATEEEIHTLFGPRVLYTVKEVTNDRSLTSEQNKQRQIEHAPQMSLNGQLVKLADRLYNIQDLENPPESWSDEKVQQYHFWGEKLLYALKGTNENLERALHAQITKYRKNAAPHVYDLSTASYAEIRKHNKTLLKDQTVNQLLLKGSGDIEHRKDYTVYELRKLIRQFESKGGRVVVVPNDASIPFQIMLPKESVVYPICKGGINRSQILYQVLEKLIADEESITMQNPHATHLGFERTHVTLLPEELQALDYGHIQSRYTKNGYLAFSKVFGKNRMPRWGYDLSHDVSSIDAGGKISTSTSSQQVFSEKYWTNDTGTRRIYIAFQSSAIAPLLRANPKNAHVIILPLSDEIYRLEKTNPDATEEAFIDCYEGMSRRLRKLFIHF